MEEVEYIDGFKTSDSECIFDYREGLYTIAFYDKEDTLGLNEDIEIETDNRKEAQEHFDKLVRKYKRKGDYFGN